MATSTTSNFLPNVPSLQILWELDSGWELECIDIESLLPGEAHTSAVSKWSGKKHCYRYPVTARRTLDKIVLSNYRRPPEWPTDAGWQYVQGTLTIILSSAGTPKSLIWERKEPHERSMLEPEKEWCYFANGARTGTLQPRGRITVEQTDRPFQALMRKLLLLTHRACVITGCEVEFCLEAAHLLPVKNGGQETTENMVLLRADMHRLYDAGQLSLRVIAGRLQVFASDEVFDYVKLAASNKQQHSELNFTNKEPWVRARLQLQPGTHHQHIDVRCEP